ncbi:MAG: ABC transporter substrate-binding protein, partial [Pseudomonadota bacterium]
TTSYKTFADKVDGGQKLLDMALAVEIKNMSPDEFNAWREIAKTTSYKTFADKVDGGQKLLDMALAVE